MKLKVLKKFVDKNNGEFYIEDMILTVSAKRGAELLAHPLELVEEIEEEKSEEPSISAEEAMANVEVKKTSKKSKSTTN